jgi:hypothetical protein
MAAQHQVRGGGHASRAGSRVSGAETHAQSTRPMSPRPGPSEGQSSRAGRVSIDESHPGEQAFDKLMRMTPAEREKALRSVPEARRQDIEQRIQQIQKLPPVQQSRVRAQLEKLNSLPPDKQEDVRRSLRQLRDMPEDRKAAIAEELQRMAALPEDQRRAQMKTKEFRNRYSRDEQRIVKDLSPIMP